MKSLEFPNRVPYELLKRGVEGLFLQCCTAKTHAPDATERLFRQSQKGCSRKPSLLGVILPTVQPKVLR